VWESDAANDCTGGFFRSLLPAMDHAYLRPNYPGYARLQSQAGALLLSFLKDGLDLYGVLGQIERIYSASTLEVSS
jgi:hypothetical protein